MLVTFAVCGVNANHTVMPMLSTRSALTAALLAAASLSLSACVAPGYTSYGAQQGYQGQYAAATYSQPAYAQPGTVQQPAYASPPAPEQPYDTQNNGQYGSQYPSQYGNQYGTQFGTISSIRPLSSATGASGIAGTVVGALVGGVLGIRSAAATVAMLRPSSARSAEPTQATRSANRWGSPLDSRSTCS